MTDEANASINTRSSLSCYLSVQPGVRIACTRDWEHNSEPGLLYYTITPVIIWEIYYVGSIPSIPSSQASLSSVKSNEQMLLSCWSQHDGPSRWQAHPSAERKWEGSSGQWTACRGALTLPRFSPSSSLIAALISDIQESFHPEPRPQHSTTHRPVHLSPCQPFCSTDHLPVMCPCPQPEKPAGEKVEIFIIRSARPLRGEEGRTERSSGGRDVIGWRLHEKSLNIFGDGEITYCKQRDLMENSEIYHTFYSWLDNSIQIWTSLTMLPNPHPTLLKMSMGDAHMLVTHTHTHT